MVYGNSSYSILEAMLLVKELAYSLLIWAEQPLRASRIYMIIPSRHSLNLSAFGFS